MADKLDPDDMHDLWRSQRTEPVRLSADDLRRKARLLEARMRRGLRLAAVLMIFVAAGYASFLYFFPGVVHRIGASLTLAGYMYCVYHLYRNGVFRRVRPGAAQPTGAIYRKELERQRDFSLSAWRTLMLPVAPGPVVFIMAFLVPEQGVLLALGLTAALILPPFALAIPLGRRKARMLQREIDDLNALMKQ